MKRAIVARTITVSTIRSRLLLLVLAALLLGVMAAALMTAGTWKVRAVVLFLTGLAGIGALWAARRIASDVEALTEACEALRKERSEFERHVTDAVDRTRDAERRIAQTQRVEALGRLTGGVSHDFNNVLGVISNSAHLLQRSAADTAVGPPLAAILRAVDLGSRLTQQLQRFAGRQPAAPRPLALASFVGDTRELIATVLGPRVRLEVDVAPGTPPVTVDSSEFELALLNLALNARDAMPRGGCVWLHARLARDSEADGLASPCVLVSVGDDGVGIDERSAARMFDPFFAANADGKMGGLGLSQVYGFCVRAGGTARITGTPGLGTTIVLLLPVSATEAASPPSNGADAAGDGQHDAGDVAGAHRRGEEHVRR